MTKLFDDAISAAQKLAPEIQDEIAQMVLLYAAAPVVILTPEEEADLAEADAEIARGEIATDAEAERVWARYRA